MQKSTEYHCNFKMYILSRKSYIQKIAPFNREMNGMLLQCMHTQATLYQDYLTCAKQSCLYYPLSLLFLLRTEQNHRGPSWKGECLCLARLLSNKYQSCGPLSIKTIKLFSSFIHSLKHPVKPYLACFLALRHQLNPNFWLQETNLDGITNWTFQ